jgi:hypothetical protein
MDVRGLVNFNHVTGKPLQEALSRYETGGRHRGLGKGKEYLDKG